MAHNIVLTNQAVTELGLQSTKRPIFFQFGKGTAADIPHSVECTVQGYATFDEGATFAWSRLGTAIVQSRDFDSTSTNPTFTFDVSSFASAYIYDEVKVFEDVINGSLQTGAPVYGLSTGLVMKVRVLGRSYFKDADTSVLTLDLSNHIQSHEIRTINAYAKDELIIANKFSNLYAATISIPKAGWISNNRIVGAVNGLFRRPLTNCPSSTIRKIPRKAPLLIQSLTQTATANEIVLVVDYTNDAGASVANESVHTTYTNDTTDILISNLSIDENLFGLLNAGTETGLKSGKFSVALKTTAATGVRLNFEIVERGVNVINQTFGSVPIDSALIYFYNDFGVLDFYLFEGFTSVSHQQGATTFAKSKSSYTRHTSRNKNNRGVSRGSTVEVNTCRTLANEETLEFLSEIQRSSKVFIYEDNSFVAVSVIQSEMIISSGDGKPFIFELSFIKESHTINY